MDIQIRLIEKACEAARKAVEQGLSRDSHRLIPDSFAAIAFQAKHDQLTAAKTGSEKP